MHPVAQIVQVEIDKIKALCEYDIMLKPHYYMWDWYLGKTKYKNYLKK